MKSFLSVLCGFFAVGYSGVSLAEELSLSVKPIGIGVEVLSQNQDFRLTELKLDHPVLAALENVKDRIPTESDITSTSLKLDYWVKPYLNVFGAVSQIEGESRVKLSQVPGISVPDMVVSADGRLYHLGTTLAVGNGRYVGALTYVHTVTDIDSATEKGDYTTLVSSVGKITDFGTFTAGILKQDLQGSFNGMLNVPGLGGIKASISAENAEKYSYLLGYHKELEKDFYLNAHAEIGERQGVRLGVSRRF